MAKKEALFEKLFELQKRLKEVEDMKKSMAKDYRDQIKDIKEEITETVMELEDCGVSTVTSTPVDFTATVIDEDTE